MGDEGMFMPCMVGQLEGQFLKMLVQMCRAKTVLDVGTFTGYSALSFAEGLPADGSVVTIENDETIAAVAQQCFDASKQASKIDLRVGNAPAILADNSLCALVYDKDDIRRQRLHEFNMMVANDE